MTTNVMCLLITAPPSSPKVTEALDAAFAFSLHYEVHILLSSEGCSCLHLPPENDLIKKFQALSLYDINHFYYYNEHSEKPSQDISLAIQPLTAKQITHKMNLAKQVVSF